MIAQADDVVTLAHEERETIHVLRRFEKEEAAIGWNTNYKKSKYMELGTNQKRGNKFQKKIGNQTGGRAIQKANKR